MVLRVIVCSMLFSYTMQSKASYWVQSQLSNLCLLSLSLVMGIAMCFFCWDIFWKLLALGNLTCGQETRLRTACCMVNANISYTLIQMDNFKHRSHTISRLSEGRIWQSVCRKIQSSQKFIQCNHFCIMLINLIFKCV